MKKIALLTLVVFSLGMLSACGGHKGGVAEIPLDQDLLKKDEGKKEDKKEDVVVNNPGAGGGNPPPPPPPADPEVLAVKTEIEFTAVGQEIAKRTNYLYRDDAKLREERIDIGGNGNDYYVLRDYNGQGHKINQTKFNADDTPDLIEIWDYEADGRIKTYKIDTDADENFNEIRTHHYNEDGSQSVEIVSDSNDNGHRDEGIDSSWVDEYDSAGKRLLSTIYNGGANPTMENHFYYNGEGGKISALCQDRAPIQHPAECDYEESWSYESAGDRIRGITKITRWRIVRGGEGLKITTEIFDRHENLVMKELRVSSGGIVTVTRERFVYLDGKLKERSIDRNNDRVIDYLEIFLYDPQGRMTIKNIFSDGVHKDRAVFNTYLPLSAVKARR